jgi:hydroxyacylglutathione hydrolase
VAEHVVRVMPEPIALGGLVIHAIPAATDNLVWIAQCAETGDAAVIDGPDAENALAVCGSRGIRLTAVWNTHTHGDHVGINRDLQRRGRIPGLDVVGPRAVAAAVPGITHPVDEGDEVRLGSHVARVMRTDGHLTGHVSFVVGEALFCGDTLFAGGCGYLFDGPPAAMFDSLLRLAALPAETLVCCAHEYTEDNLRFARSVEPDNAALIDRIGRVAAIRAEWRCTLPSTVAEERATNPFLRPGSPTILRRLREELPEADLSTPVAVFTATRALKDTKRYRSAP